VQAVQLRVFGTFGQPNWLAAYLIMMIPLAGSRLIETFIESVIWKRVAFLIVIALYFSTLLFTASRSGLLGLAAGAGTYVLYLSVGLWKKTREEAYGKSKDKKKSDVWRPLLAAGTLTAVVFTTAVLAFGTPVTPTLTQLLQKISDKRAEQKAEAAPSNSTEAEVPQGGTQLDIGGSESGDIRRVVWKGAVEVWKRYPIFGSGVETFAYSYYQDRPMEQHNNCVLVAYQYCTLYLHTGDEKLF
jgi:O-antigen ligase